MGPGNKEIIVIFNAFLDHILQYMPKNYYVQGFDKDKMFLVNGDLIIH